MIESERTSNTAILNESGDARASRNECPSTGSHSAYILYLHADFL